MEQKFFIPIFYELGSFSCWLIVPFIVLGKTKIFVCLMCVCVWDGCGLVVHIASGAHCHWFDPPFHRLCDAEAAGVPEAGVREAPGSAHGQHCQSHGAGGRETGDDAAAQRGCQHCRSNQSKWVMSLVGEAVNIAEHRQPDQSKWVI